MLVLMLVWSDRVLSSCLRSESSAHSCLHSCPSIYRWAKLSTHRHKGPHECAVRALTPPLAVSPLSCLHSLTLAAEHGQCLAALRPGAPFSFKAETNIPKAAIPSPLRWLSCPCHNVLHAAVFNSIEKIGKDREFVDTTAHPVGRSHGCTSLVSHHVFRYRTWTRVQKKRGTSSR